MFRRITCLILVLLLAAGSDRVFATDTPDAQELLPIKAFARHAQVMMPRLSPDGKYVSVRVDDADGAHHKLLVYRISDFSIVSQLRMPIYEVPVDTIWVSPTRLVVAKGEIHGSLDRPHSTGEMIATDLDGTNQAYLFGYKNVGRRSVTRGKDYATGVILGTPDKVNGTFYMAVHPWDKDEVSRLYIMDAESNSRDMIADMDVSGMDFVVDHDGKPRFASGVNGEFEFVAWRNQHDHWIKLDPETWGERFEPFAYAPDNKTVYAQWSNDGGPFALITQDENGGRRTLLASNEFYDVGGLQWTAPPLQPFAVTLAGGVPEAVIFQPNLPEAKLYASLQKAFPHGYVDFINFSEDGKQLLFSVSSDRDPGTYYLLDVATLKATKLFAPRSWIDPATMSERRPVHFKASDGLELEAILTLPRGKGEHNLPMVLMPHGGPHGVEDTWFYDNDAQFLASRGYLVLQVNFRGSAGRGVNFEQSGYRNWGTRIQQDLIDGVKWTIEQKLADPDRICVYGASFGGYSAMMAPIRAPDLFQCAIGYAGVYDLGMMFEKGDIAERDFGINYLKVVLGSDPDELKANSPADLAEKITVPVLLIHGEDDRRAPIEQAEAMRDALKAAGKSYQWLVRDDEGHGFYNEENKIAALTAIQDFLAEHIGEKTVSTK